ncbi:MAG: ribonuclease D [Proteobacteria bacterium]|nr:ribonuclease D [Pseudomonadota bacterium]
MNIPYLHTTAQLEAFCDAARTAGRVAIDAEFIPENTYYPQLALLQLASDSGAFLLDPLSGVALTTLFRIIADPAVRVIVHAGTQDMAILSRLGDMAPQNIFDTQVAAAMIGMGHQVSYAHLVAELTGTVLKKGEHLSDWLHRPLRPNQERYAIEDVLYLLPCADVLQARIDALGRDAWLREDLSHYVAPVTDADLRAQAWRRVRGKQVLPVATWPLLQALAAWREEEAMTRDLPRKKILSDEALLCIVQTQPHATAQLFDIPTFSRRGVREYGQQIISIVKESPRKSSPQRIEETPCRHMPMYAETLERLYARFQARCAELSVAQAQVGTRAEIEKMVCDHLRNQALVSSHHRLLRGWRAEAVGRVLLDCLAESA